MATKSDKLILQGEKRMNIAENAFNNNVKKAESAILEEIRKLFEVVDVSGGKLRTNTKTTEFLMSLEFRILGALNKSGYNSAVGDLLKNFDIIRQNNIDIQSTLNKKNIAFSSLNDITKLEVQNTIEKLTNSGISKDFITPIRESLYRNIALGSDIIEAQKTITDYILSSDGTDSKLLRYTKQVSRDALSQYDGAIQKAIANELNLKDYLYTGSLIADSRGQCQYWVKKKKLLHEELKAEIAQAVAGRTLGSKQCSGMIPGTNTENFSINRGGYNCRHRAIATNFKR